MILVLKRVRITFASEMAAHSTLRSSSRNVLTVASHADALCRATRSAARWTAASWASCARFSSAAERAASRAHRITLAPSATSSPSEIPQAEAPPMISPVLVAIASAPLRLAA